MGILTGEWIEPVKCPACEKMFEPVWDRMGPRVVFRVKNGPRQCFYSSCPHCSNRMLIRVAVKADRMVPRKLF